MESVSIEHLVTYRFGNLEVEISLEENPDGDEVQRILSVTSYCRPYNMRNVLGKFRTVWKCKRPDLFLQHQLLEHAHTEDEIVLESESLENKLQQI